MVHLSKRYGAIVALCLLLTMMSLHAFLSKPAFADGMPNQTLTDAPVQHSKLFLLIQGVDTSLPASDAHDGIISAQETFGIPNGLYPFLKATYPQASFLMFSYNGDKRGICCIRSVWFPMSILAEASYHPLYRSAGQCNFSAGSPSHRRNK